MLQWMGGSRRKVTTSRKSTYKRQKQYFEQRRGQQQQRAGLESYFDGKRSCDYSRSLDILSLQSLSTVAQEHNTSTTTGTPSNGTELEYPKKVSVHLRKDDGNLAGNFSELDSVKLSMSQQIRVIDLLGDDSTSNADENSLRQEGHVAFSVEGLGQVETETPVHSPKMPGRSFLDCYSPPKKAVRVPITSEHLDYGFHGLGSRLDIDFSPCSSTIDQSFCNRDMIDADGDTEQNFLNFRTPSPYNWNYSNMHGLSRNDELVYNKRDSSRTIWEDRSFFDDGSDDLEEQESLCTHFDGRYVGFDDYYLPKSPWKQDIDFEGWDINKKRSSIRPQTYNVKESPGPFPKHPTMKDLHGIKIPDNRWHSDIEIGNDVKDNNSVTEESRSRSLRSERCFDQ